MDPAADPTVDLRSDTVTRPTPAMRQAMAAAEVGDDTLGDDPTVRALEERVADLLGKEAALFFPSGVMANQTALAVLGEWGTEVVVEGGAHLFHFEEGAGAALKGLQLHPVPTDDGVLRPEHLERAVRSGSRYQPRTSLVCIENTHLASGGRVISPEQIEALAVAARDRGLPVHMDGARLWHAAAAANRPLTDFTAPVDTVMVCLSKGLGAPVGSLLAGPAAVMEEGWRVRRRFGGGMRQSGVLAAAGLHALEHHRDELSATHEATFRLAAAFEALPGFRVVAPETNVLLVDAEPEGPQISELLRFLRFHRILMLEFGPRRLRAVMHRDVDSPAMVRVLDALARWVRHGGAT